MIYSGQSLDQFTQRGGKAVVLAENGEIVGRTVPNSPNSFLCTNREFADFDLELEFKVDPRLNSGVQIRSNSFAGYNSGVVHGYQVEIDPTPRAFSGGIYDESRRGWLADLKGNEAARKAFRQNEWNALRVEARGSSLRTWVNGVSAVEHVDELTSRGFIALQVHSTQSTEPLEVRWRNIRIRDYGDPSLAPPPGAHVLLGESSDLSAWQSARKTSESAPWSRKNSELEVIPGSGDIITRAAFGDCRLHVEFAVDDNGKEGQANGNSGVYVQGRYEVQILNSAGQAPADDNCGAIYKRRAADFNCGRAAGEWQTYDIDFTAPRWDAAGKKAANARITVRWNGTRVHQDVEIEGATGAGEAEAPGDRPLRLQDHGNRVRFRNIWILPRGADSARP